MIVATLASLIVTISADAAKFAAGLKGVEKDLNRTGRTLSGIGQSLTTAVTLPIVGIGAAALKMSTDFNRSMANVGSLIPGNTARVNELKTAVQDMAVRTGQATGDLAGGLYQVISAFGDTADTARVLEINARAAAAGVATTTDAINLTSAVTKGYGDTSAEAVQKVSDLALLTVRLGQTEFPALAASMGRVVPLAVQLKVSQEELFGVMATVTGVTGDAAEASTQLRGILQALMAPTDTMAQLFEKLGVQSGQALLKQYGLQGTIKLLADSAEASGIPLQKLIGSIEGQTQALAIANPQYNALSIKLAEMQHAAGTTDAAFREQTEGVNKAGFALQQAKQQATVLSQRLGDALAPALLSVLQGLQPVIDHVKLAVAWFQGLSEHGKAVFLSVVAVAAAAGPLALGFAGVIKVIASVIASARLLGAASIWLVTTPFGRVLLALTALVTASVLVAENWDAVRYAALTAWGLIKAAVAASIAAIIDAYAGFIGFFNKAKAEEARISAAWFRDQANQEIILLIERQSAYEEDKLAKQAAEQAKAAAAEAASEAMQKAVADAQRASEAAAAAAAQVNASTVADLGVAVGKKITLLDMLAAKLQHLDAEWAIYQAAAGKAAESAEGLAKKKEFLLAKLAMVGQQIEWLSGQYGTAIAKTGEYSEESLGLAGQLDGARQKMAELGAQVRDNNVAMVEFTPAVLAVKADIDDLNKVISSLTRTQSELSAQLKDAQEKLAGTAEKIKGLRDASSDARQGIRDALRAMGEHVADLETRMKSARQGIRDALQDMSYHVGQLADKISQTRSNMQALGDVRLAGQTAFEDQIASLTQRENQLKLALVGLKMLGDQAPKDAVDKIEQQLSQMSLVKEQVTLQRELEVEPMRRELKRLTASAQEFTFDEARNAIEDYKADLTRLTDEHKKAASKLAEMTASVADVIEETKKLTFDQAVAAIADYRTKLLDLSVQHGVAKAKLDEMTAAVAGLIGPVTLTFDQAVAAIDKHRKTIADNDAELALLMAQQDKEKAAVQGLTVWLGLTTAALTTHEQKLKDANVALEGLRKAAQDAAASLGAIGTPAPAMPVPPVPVQVAQAVTASGTIAQAAGAAGTTAATAASLPPISTTYAGPEANLLSGKPLPAVNLNPDLQQLLLQYGLASTAAGIPTGTPYLPGIRFMAEGGIVARPTLAMIGESGPEAVIPLSRGQGGTVINVRVEGPVYGVLDFEQRVTQTIRDAIQGGAFRGVIPAR